MLKNILKGVLKRNIGNEKDVAILLSGGIDSRALLEILIEMDKNITIYSFHMKNVNSTDYCIAKKISEFYNLKFVEIELPIEKEIILNELKEIIPKYKLYKKTSVECVWAMWHTLRKVKENIIISGLWADAYFCISKKGMIHYSKSIYKMNEFRNNYFQKGYVEQNNALKMLSKENKKIMVNPFDSEEVFNFFKDKSWEELNKPHQKQPIYEIVSNNFKKEKHTNFQKGDSKLSETFEKLIENTSYKSVVSLYHDIYKGALIELWF